MDRRTTEDSPSYMWTSISTSSGDKPGIKLVLRKQPLPPSFSRDAWDRRYSKVEASTADVVNGLKRPSSWTSLQSPVSSRSSGRATSTSRLSTGEKLPEKKRPKFAKTKGPAKSFIAPLMKQSLKAFQIKQSMIRNHGVRVGPGARPVTPAGTKEPRKDKSLSDKSLASICAKIRQTPRPVVKQTILLAHVEPRKVLENHGSSKKKRTRAPQRTQTSSAGEPLKVERKCTGVLNAGPRTTKVQNSAGPKRASSSAAEEKRKVAEKRGSSAWDDNPAPKIPRTSRSPVRKSREPGKGSRKRKHPSPSYSDYKDEKAGPPASKFKCTSGIM